MDDVVKDVDNGLLWTYANLTKAFDCLNTDILLNSIIH